MDVECCCQPQIAVKLESVLSSAVGLAYRLVSACITVLPPLLCLLRL